MRKKVIFLLTAALLSTQWSCEMKKYDEITFKTVDGALIEASVFGDYSSPLGVVLAHGMIFDRESWYDFAQLLSSKGFTALSFNFRGYGNSVEGREGKKSIYPDVLGGVKYLKEKGIQKVCVTGASMGAIATIDAVLNDNERTIDKIILLSPPPHNRINEVGIPALFLYSKNEKLASRIEKMFGKATGQKKLKSFKGDAHGQHIFNTENRQMLENEIITYLRED